MNSVRACRCSHVGAIVDQESRCCARGNRRRSSREFIQHADAQVLFTDLNDINFGSDRQANELKNVLQFFTVRRGCGTRSAARYEIDQGVWRELGCERHCLLKGRLFRYQPAGLEQSA